jgi:hypothetical protein
MRVFLSSVADPSYLFFLVMGEALLVSISNQDFLINENQVNL